MARTERSREEEIEVSLVFSVFAYSVLDSDVLDMTCMVSGVLDSLLWEGIALHGWVSEYRTQRSIPRACVLIEYRSVYSFQLTSYICEGCLYARSEH